MSSKVSSKVERLANYVRLDPNNLALRADLADELIDSGSASDALTHIDHALRLRPEHPQFRFRRAVALRRAGRAEEAQVELDTLLAEGKSDAAVFYERADLALQMRDFDACLQWVGCVMELPDYRRAVPGADLLRVRALHYLGRLDEAIAHAETVLKADPARDDLRSALATLYLDTERYADAARLYAESGKEGTCLPELECVGGYLALAEEKTSLAQQRFVEVLRVRPNDGRALLGAGLASAADGSLAQAIGYLQRASAAMPNHLGTMNGLAWMQLLSGQLDAAEATLTRAQAVDDTFSESYGGQAVIAAMRGDRATAQALIRTALRLDRNCFSAAYAGMLLQHGSAPNAATLDAALQFLAGQPAPGGGTLKATVLRMARGAQRGAGPKA